MSPSRDAPQTDKSFSFQIAGRYLAARDKKIKFSLDGQKYHLQISTKRFDSRVFQRLTRHSGGYHQIDEGGFQVLLN